VSVLASSGRFARRGTASMPPEQRVAIARKGGLAVHATGKAHEWTRAEAIAHGRKGGLAPRKRRDPDGDDAA
jgi:uncharacterized protein